MRRKNMYIRVVTIENLVCHAFFSLLSYSWFFIFGNSQLGHKARTQACP